MAVICYLIDTDVCSAHLRGSAPVTQRLLKHAGEVGVSVVTVGELLSWTLRATTPVKYQQALQQFLSDLHVFDVDQRVAWRFGEVRALLFDQGTPVGSMDLLIGATALVHGLTMVTHYLQHFVRIPGLPVEDWLGP